MASAAEQSINAVLRNFETVSRRHAEITSCIEEVESKIDTTTSLDCTTFAPPPSSAVVEASDELMVSDNQPEELRIIELKTKFREAVMKNSENIALLHSKIDEELRAEIMNQANISEARGVAVEQRLHQIEEKFDRYCGNGKEDLQALLALHEDVLKEEMRQEIGQHAHKMNEEVKRHLADAEELHRDMKSRIGGVEVELKPLVHEPQFLTADVRAKLEKLVHEVESTFTHHSDHSGVHTM